MADYLRSGVDEASFVRPANDLYEAVRAWYARRNATAHYGLFVPGDPQQTSQSWYKRALATTAPPGDGPMGWLWSFRQAVASILHRDLQRVGRPLV